MLQQTQVETVIPYYHRFLSGFPDVYRLAEASLQDVLKLWEGLGYYARVRHLHQAAQQLVRDYGGQLPESFEQWKQLPGVGDYIAAAVCSIAFNLPYAVVDGNVKRVLSRLLGCELPINQTSATRQYRMLAQELLDIRQPGQHNQAMMELGATVCKPRRPQCASCPVQKFCLAFKDGRQETLPLRLPGNSIPEYIIAVGVVHKNGKVLITRRKAEGLLGGLWEFPGGKVRAGESPAQACRREILEEVGLQIKVEAPIAQIRHAYSHFKIVLHVFHCSYLEGSVKLNGPVDYRWVALQELNNYPFPGANRKFIPRLLEATSCSDNPSG